MNIQQYGTCSACGTLPDELKVNYGNEQRYPEAYNKLQVIYSNNSDVEYRRCSVCKTYFIGVDFPQEYGSGNNAEEIINRFSDEQSYHLHTMLTSDEFYNPGLNEVSAIVKLIPRHHLIFALYAVKSPNAYEQFIYGIACALSQCYDLHYWNLVKDFIGENKQRAETALKILSSQPNHSNEKIEMMVVHCKNIVAG